MNTLEIILICIFALLFIAVGCFATLYAIKSRKINQNKEHKTLSQFLNNKSNYFTNFEKIWFFGLIAIAVIISICLPEESVNGIDGRLITIMYLADIVFAMLCELLISKQSKWNAILYLLVEAIEFSTLIMLRARIASLAIILVFWVPMHIITFVNWHKHPDKKEKELTVVRQLKWWQSLILILVTIAWTAGIGYVVAAYGPETDFFTSDTTAKVVAYLDACFSILGIIDGILVAFRFKEATYVWIIAALIETTINIITGQWVLLILKAGYLINCFYGLAKWTKYIKTHKTESEQVQTTDAQIAENI